MFVYVYIWICICIYLHFLYFRHVSLSQTVPLIAGSRELLDNIKIRCRATSLCFLAGQVWIRLILCAWLKFLRLICLIFPLLRGMSLYKDKIVASVLCGCHVMYDVTQSEFFVSQFWLSDLLLNEYYNLYVLKSLVFMYCDSPNDWRNQGICLFLVQ